MDDKSESYTSNYVSDLFLLEYEDLPDSPRVACAECRIDTMHQAVVCFHNLQADGFGHDTYSWYSNVYLRRNRIAKSVEFVIEDDGYGDLCYVERVWENIDAELWDSLVEACYEDDAKRAFELMFEITGDDLRICELTDADEERIKDLPLSFFTEVPRERLQRQVSEIAAEMQLEAYPFQQVIKEVLRVGDGERKPSTGVVYLPDRIGEMCTTNAAQVAAVTSRWFALRVNQAVANHVFLAGLLNTPLGVTIRQSLESSHLQRVRPENFAGSTLYLPSLEVQKGVVKAVETIRSSGQNLAELDSRLWQDPLDFVAVLEKLSDYDPLASFAGWIDTLPFPLASILWAYHVTEDDAEKRYRKLLQFFEALAEYAATVHVSAFLNDKGKRWAEAKDKISGSFARQHLSIERATFGTWVCLFEILAKETRRLLEEQPGECLELFRTRDLQLIRAISSRTLVTLLKEANNLRNDWHGHGGAVGMHEAELRYGDLREKLNEVREVFGAVWRESRILRPGASRYDGSRHHYEVEMLVGARTPFARATVVTSELLQNGQLYLWHAGNDKALMLLPLIKIQASPKTEENACYYYSRLQGDKPRYLSYHFGADSDITLEDGSDVIQALDRLGLS